MVLPDRLVNDVALPLRRRLKGDILASRGRTREAIERNRDAAPAHAPPRRARRALRVEQRSAHGWPVYELTPRRRTPGAVLVYLHGGAYFGEITRWHWRFVAHLVREAQVRCVVPIYPLVPLATAAAVVETATALCAEQLEAEAPGRVVVAGDSAGGGIALAATLALRDREAPQPRRLVLISPLLDVTLSDPRQLALEGKDKMLRRPGLIEAGSCYAGGLPVDDPRVSPIHADLEGIAPITVFTGTHDLLDIDARRLADAAAAAGVAVELREEHGAPHAYPLLPTPQGARARAQIARLLRGR